MSQRDDLEILRATLLEALTEADASVKAQIAGQLRQVVKDLAALGEPTEETSVADEIAARREARRTPSSDRSSPSGRGQRRRRSGVHRTG